MNLQVQQMKIDVPFEAKGDPQFWLSCIGAMMEDKMKAINLYQIWKEQNKEQQKIQDIDIMEHLIFPAVSLVVCMVLFGGVMFWNVHTSGQISDINDWINDEQVQSEYQEANALREESDRLAEAQRQVEEMTANLDTYPDLTKKMISRIIDASGKDMEVHIKTMDADTGTLTFDAVSKKVIDIPGYVQKLQKTGLFASVDYTGYSYEQQYEEYSLALSCVLKEAATGGDEN